MQLALPVQYAKPLVAASQVEVRPAFDQLGSTLGKGRASACHAWFVSTTTYRHHGSVRTYLVNRTLLDNSASPAGCIAHPNCLASTRSTRQREMCSGPSRLRVVHSNSRRGVCHLLWHRPWGGLFPQPGHGALNWRKSLASVSQFLTAPVLAANGCVYLQDDNDVLYCVDQFEGTLIWACDCSRCLPGGKPSRPKKTGFPHYDPDPTVTSTGDVIVPGQAAVFCVAGYQEGTLDRLAPGPKWQHDLYNTGYVSGGK